mmetsp:Transcript_8901/g.22456  ORF Transcript_8901/g.22456 Transcript_8901/m.22456 type:complete len:675 (+) Transcript_8901:105-2129(+)
MSNARKLQTEIDRTMKKVDEGVELFDEIWEKLYSAEQSNQKEKYEGELKKEIKKLQRLRDTIKSWISGNDVKDKDPLLDARKLIETKMEAFKTCEKEMKTKTYSKEGLAKAEQLSPEEEAKQRTNEWISECVDKLTTLVQDQEVEVERLQAGKGKKTNKHLIEECKHYINMHKFHLQKLEGVMRLVTNDVLEVDIVDPLKDDLDYYLESYNDTDYLQAYDEEFFYEALGLENLDVVNVDRVTTIDGSDAGKGKKGGDDDVESKTSKGSSKDTKKSKKSTATSGMIPLTIGRARASKGGATDTPTMPMPMTKSSTRLSRDSSHGTMDGDDSSTGKNTPSKTKKVLPEPTTIPAAQGASMAAILKREAEQQEKERQAKAAEQLRAQQAQQQAALRQQQEAQLRQQQQQQQEAAALRQRQEAAAKQKALQEQQQQQQAAALRQQQEAQLRQQQQAAQQQQDAASQHSSGGASGAAAGAPSSGASASGGGTAGLDIISGLNGLNLGNSSAAPGSVGTGTSVGGIDFGSTVAAASAGNNNGMVQESFSTIPTASDQDRSRTYTPQNPYPGTPASYPSTPSALFDNPAIFEKLGTDALFFIFYYKQGTYQQYLAARELKKQSWRFHKKYMTWFQRHEEPKVTTDEYEQGTYVYFDYETGWCTRIKQDFRFEYSFLEDTLQ